MRWPVDTPVITQGYKANPYQYGYGAFGHTGIDLRASVGTSVKSPVSGIVIGVGTNPSYVGGLYVIVRQDGGDRWECYMGHLSKTLVSVGQRVGEGQEIAKSGQTGNVTGPHVHFQVRHYGAGALVNPADLITTNGADMITQNDRSLIERLSTRLKLWNPGFDMNKEMNAWVGQDFRKFLGEGMNEADAEFKRREEAASKVNQLSGQITGLTQTVNEKQAEINTLVDENTKLKAKLAQAGSDSVQLTALGTLLNWLIVRLGLKKG